MVTTQRHPHLCSLTLTWFQGHTPLPSSLQRAISETWHGGPFFAPVSHFCNLSVSFWKHSDPEVWLHVWGLTVWVLFCNLIFTMYISYLKGLQIYGDTCTAFVIFFLRSTLNSLPFVPVFSIFSTFISLSVCVLVCECGSSHVSTHVTVPMWRSEDWNVSPGFLPCLRQDCLVHQYITG